LVISSVGGRSAEIEAAAVDGASRDVVDRGAGTEVVDAWVVIGGLGPGLQAASALAASTPAAVDPIQTLSFLTRPSRH